MFSVKNMKIFYASALIFCLILKASAGCGKNEPRLLKMATTTSTDNTGLLDYLKPHVKNDLNIDLRWVGVGTGKALELGKNCDVDILFVHDPAAEKKYISDGFGIDRRPVMHNDFIVIGPDSDPAGVRDANAKQAFSLIAAKKACFVSRGDKSGTHEMEISLWQDAGIKIPDRETWYIQTGQGMINTINIAAERNGYTLADRGTFIKYEAIHKGKPRLCTLVEGDSSLQNRYSVISVNPANCNDVQIAYASQFSNWIVSEKAQMLIADFRLMNKRLFIPDAGK